MKKSQSDKEDLTNRAVVSLQTQWTEIYREETITLSCKIVDGDDSEWEYEWGTTSSDTILKHSEHFTISVTANNDGDYKCRGKLKTDPHSSTEWSAPVTVRVSEPPEAELRADVRDIPLGGDATLTCSVSSSSGWSYQYLYRRDKSSNFVAQNANLSGQLRVSEEGLYQCRGRRGNPPYYTKYSEEIMINKKNANEAVLTLHPNWSEVYRGETITLRCDIKDGANTEWEYEWETTSSDKPSKQKEYSITSVYVSHTGNYRCRGRRKSDRSSTKWSRPISLTVLYSKPVLTVSQSWLSPGDSVTLSCDVKHPSAGWRFFWYKAIPKLPGDSYNYELLSESRNGTEKHSYIVHGETHTSGYACRAGRGDPVKFTHYSKPKFVWSGGSYLAASLTVSPDRVQHFISDSVSLTCVGNSSQWRVKMFHKDGSLKDCSQDKMTGSTCIINQYTERNHVYWCESGSGEFSNAINTTKQNGDIILVTPVRSVTEGSPVSLSCKLRYAEKVSNVFFYQNDKLIQSDTRRELNISAVSKSDEGFYKCQISGRESSQSWMSVKVIRPVSSSFPLIPMNVGLICGVVIIILLALLYRYWQSKASSLKRPVQSESNDQGRHGLYQNVSQHEHYSTLLHADRCVYETIRISEDSTGDDHIYESVEGSEVAQTGTCLNFHMHSKSSQNSVVYTVFI
ncbi:Fc receptor-like protein 5 [Cheilinus undulatus]|uniref:Fc receptor-like protein 5 n=1 Tax=Cheilinus undulatus TaxID=241271 RepID=UPI001BD4710D|nr:Fc receptor-like protein 5 [Cheilinus undulatus]